VQLRDISLPNLPRDWANQPGSCPPHVEDGLVQIFGVIQAHRRVMATEPPAEPRIHPDHFQRLAAFLTSGTPIHFVLPAFPAKSANPRKVLGERADLGELLSLRFLDDLCARIESHHRPGVRLTICSDGRVFSDLVGVRDEAVTRYRADLQALIERHQLRHLDLVDLDDLYPRRDYQSVRAELMAAHGQPLEDLQRALRSDRAGVALVNGIHRFLLEDLAALCPGLTRSKARAASRTLAYQTIHRSNAWSRAVAERFPQAIRLSIHPQPPGSPKLGILLLAAADVWRTPWHAVVLDTGTEFRLVRRVDAETAGARVQTLDGRPSYFVAAGARPQELPR
jgi:pyoverdine/dityrosine biosynthesis protein Dit1